MQLIFMTKMQRNPSTGKRIRNQVTGKLQRAVPPPPCSDCPTWGDVDEIDVELSDIIFIPDPTCFDCGPGQDAVKYSGITDLNGTYRLELESNCVWIKNFVTPTLFKVISRRNVFGPPYCTTRIISADTFTNFDLALVRFSDGHLELECIYGESIIFKVSYNATMTTCTEISGEDNLITSTGCIGSAQSANRIASGGTVTVTEV